MIIITGALGFIGSCLVRKFNDSGIFDLVLVDDFSRTEKVHNLKGKLYKEEIERDEFLTDFSKIAHQVSYVFHIGARTDTTEQEVSIFDKLNLNYSKTLWQLCCLYQIPLVYASSAATYGLGENGYEDNHQVVEQLKPLNPYGISKNDFDRWVLIQKEQPPFWAGLKFFNVYGPNEYHKGRMASVIFHTVKQIKATGMMRLFRSHRPDIAHGQQKRDFIYVKDVVDMIYFFYGNQPPSGLYNVGTGQARSFFDLASNTFEAMGLKPHIEFIDTPADIRDNYQYFTEANMTKLRIAGYSSSLYTLEAGIEDYVKNYLIAEKVW